LQTLKEIVPLIFVVWLIFFVLQKGKKRDNGYFVGFGIEAMPQWEVDVLAILLSEMALACAHLTLLVVPLIPLWNT
jgi:hypothetical protein